MKSDEQSVLTDREKRRYNKQIQLSDIGIEGQLKLKQSRVAVIGAGGLGAPVLQYLTSAGVGFIEIFDNDVVTEENLHRQILYGSIDIGKLKTIIAKERLSKLNDLIDLRIRNIRIDADNGLNLLHGFDVIVNTSDNFETRYALSDISVKLNVPLVHAAVYRYEGEVAVFNYNNGPSYRCLHPTPPEENEAPQNSDLGLLGVHPGIIGSIQASETIKVLLNRDDVLSGKFFVLNCMSLESQIFTVKKNPKNFELETFQ